MAQRLTYGIVRDAPRRVIHVVRVQDAILDTRKIVELAERMRERMASRGETLADVVVIQGDSKETLRLLLAARGGGGPGCRFAPSGLRRAASCDCAQNSPTIFPSPATSIRSADGILGRPGMVRISPQITTTNSAPAESRTSRTGMT